MLSTLYNISFEDLYSREGLEKLDRLFLQKLQECDQGIYQKLLTARSCQIPSSEESELLIELAQYIDSFLIDLFQLQHQAKEFYIKQQEFKTLFECKKYFIQRYVLKQLNLNKEDALNQLEDAKAKLISHGYNFKSEIEFAKLVEKWTLEGREELLYSAAVYATHMIHSSEPNKGELFIVPQKLDYNNLIKFTHNTHSYCVTSSPLRNRAGFELNDSGLDNIKSVGQSKYCIYCHNQNKDSCSKGMEKNNQPIKNQLGIELKGCPLNQKISEMNYLKAHGFLFAALAVTIIDNPMLAATGHRICNDCTKACIYQKQEPVDIPLIETETLQTVLELPFGFEIYSLLTRWNPMNFSNWLPAAATNKKVLVVGLGPAGFTLAHYLLNQGVTIVAIDGLKIEPLPPHLSGIDQNGNRSPFSPIQNISDLYDNLDSRIAGGFGGVAEYGITNRWNKNYLKIIRLLLERRDNFRMYGGIRLGSNISYVQAQSLGFHHIALALGAGAPNMLPIPNILAKGVRTASDFLMSLQLSGAARTESLANLQLELPIVVIGGGLTAVDAATEALNYYAKQVEKLLQKHNFFGDSLFASLSIKEKKLADKFLKHARILKSNPQQKAHLLQKWGGATIVYRKNIQQSPSYKLNHEELAKALEEGVQFLENIIPESIEIDEEGQCIGLKHRSGIISARTILLAIGTKPNTVLAKEDPENFQAEESYFELNTNSDYSVFGDLHPQYSGNVVKAMASAKRGYPLVMEQLKRRTTSADLVGAQEFFTNLDHLLLSRVSNISRLTRNIFEITLHSKLAAQNFLPGQFYRLQNYEYNALSLNGYKCALEPLALTGASVDKEAGTLSMIVLEMGGSSNFCSQIQQNEIVNLMGPTGSPTEIPFNQNILLIGGGLGNAVLFSIGQAMKKNGCQVLYFAGYKKKNDRYREEEIEKAADIIVWCCEEEILSSNRSQDMSLKCNLTQAIAHYSQNIKAPIKLGSIDRMLVIGSDQMMAALTYARYNQFQDIFRKDMISIGSINSPMQCMMKEICGQCLQLHKDVEGEDRYVYSCFEQDQDLNKVDFKCLKQRLSQNSLMEKVTQEFIKLSSQTSEIL